MGWLLVSLLLGWVGGAAALRTWLSQELFSTQLISPATWQRLLVACGTPEPERLGDMSLYTVPWTSALGLAGGLMGLLAILGMIVIVARVPRERWTPSGCRFGIALGGTGLGLYLWEYAWLLATLLGGETGAAILTAVLPFWIAGLLAALATATLSETALVASENALDAGPRASRLLGLMGLYAAVYVTLNWRLWFNLYIPHGDSAMYEEHLWNLLHGKGFRSYLDQGLFLGEHLQVVHLALLPWYVVWPSHLLLELCESVALAAGVFPVAWMTRRHTGSRQAAYAAAAAYLLYTPMQFLDIEIDLKTFRPEAFGIPLLLLTLDQLDRGRLRGFLLGVLACLTVKEDYTLTFGPLGLWILMTSWWAGRSPSTIAGRRWLITGGCLLVGSGLSLWLATRVVMPWFRPGQEIHYASYFSRLGETPEAIVRTILTRPGFVAGELLTPATLLYALALLVPVGGLALLSPGRLAVGVPFWSILCLNELARDPRHQFHAPLVAIVFWATAAGLGRWPDFVTRWLRIASTRSRPEWLRLGSHWLWTSSLATGLWFSLSPLGVPFWDPGSNWNAWRLYGPTSRGADFAAIAPRIPVTARVASTDFVHPRFTHYERSYDYSAFRRQVSGYERRVPDDTEYIVIDTTHPYSRWKTPGDVPEYHESDKWELLAEGAFIVLKRRE